VTAPSVGQCTTPGTIYTARVAGSDRHQPRLLRGVPRAESRKLLGLTGPTPFTGADLWTAYEMSWLDRGGRPHVAILRFSIRADTPNLLESKSVKLYLNSFSGERLEDAATLEGSLARELGEVAGGPVQVALTRTSDFGDENLQSLAGDSLDDLDLESVDEAVNPGALAIEGPGPAVVVAETLVSDLLKTNCPITGQPDWASVQIAYRGPRIARAGLLRYIVSYRRHTGFHESCVERIFMDLLGRCGPERLTVYARYTRRGGVDINPFRTNAGLAPPVSRRTPRQ
jgi:7-cyano-7-deazaguanine reductase